MASAVDHLEAAVAGQPASSAALNDLAAAYFVRAHVEENPSDLVAALEALERALRIDPQLTEARFNRALVLARLGLVQAADRAWQEVARDEPRPEWAAEATARRGTLASVPPGLSVVGAWIAGEGGGDPPTPVAALISQSPAALIRCGFDELLPSWAERWLAGDTQDAGHRLRRLRRLGEGAPPPEWRRVGRHRSAPARFGRPVEDDPAGPRVSRTRVAGCPLLELRVCTRPRHGTSAASLVSLPPPTARSSCGRGTASPQRCSPLATTPARGVSWPRSGRSGSRRPRPLCARGSPGQRV